MAILPASNGSLPLRPLIRPSVPTGPPSPLRGEGFSSWCRNAQQTERAAPLPDSGGVLEAVAALPPKYRWPVYLHYIEGYTADEIGRLLGCPRSTVLSRLSRARARLKDALKEEWT